MPCSLSYLFTLVLLSSPNNEGAKHKAQFYTFKDRKSCKYSGKPAKRHHSLYPEVQQSRFLSVHGEPMCRTEGRRTLGMGYCSVLWAPGVSGSLTHLLASVPISHCHTGHTQATEKQCSHLHQPQHLGEERLESPLTHLLASGIACLSSTSY